MFWGVTQIQKQIKWVYSGSSPFRCLWQQGIEDAPSILSIERFFLTPRGFEARRDRLSRQLDHVVIKLFLFGFFILERSP
jgi:hypothetical protein